VHVDLEVEVTADGAGIAGLADEANGLAGPDALTAVDQGGLGHVGVEVGAVLAFAVDQEVVAVEDRVIAGPQDLAAPDRYQRRAAGGDDVKALVGAAAIAGGTEFADRAAGAVRTLDGEDVAVVGGRTVAIGDSGRSWNCENREEEEG
jgi:hypothetical protein